MSRNKEHRGAAFGGAPNGAAAFGGRPIGTVFSVSAHLFLCYEYLWIFLIYSLYISYFHVLKIFQLFSLVCFVIYLVNTLSVA